MDERKFQAWKEIVEKKDDPLAPPPIIIRRSDLYDLIEELEKLKKWKAEATVILDQWEEAWVAAGCPGKIGQFKAHSVRNLFLKDQPDLPEENK